MGVCDLPVWHLCLHVHCDSDASQVKLGTVLYKLKADEICSHRPGSTGPCRLLKHVSMTICLYA